jgi:hypothetical protein
MAGAINKAPLPDESNLAYFVNPVGATLALAVADASLVCHLPDGTTRPSQVGDVLSWNPIGFGTWETRPATTAGVYETVAISGNIATYFLPGPPGGYLFLARFLYVPVVPNV